MQRNIKRRLMTIANQILRAPNAFDMQAFGKVDKPMCGTVCCVAGQALVNAGAKLIGDDIFVANASLRRRIEAIGADVYGWPSVRGDNTIKGCEHAARNVLGLSMAEGNRLFYLHEWPYKYQGAYNHAKSPKGRARAGHNRIRHFIATDGAE